jgi:hypothetical protein
MAIRSESFDTADHRGPGETLFSDPLDDRVVGDPEPQSST